MSVSVTTAQARELRLVRVVFSGSVPQVDATAASDALNEYIQHVGSGLFAIPPGISQGGYIGQTLFG